MQGDGGENPLEVIFRSMRVRRENYEKDTLNSRQLELW
jgi:hypothetical protein